MRKSIKKLGVSALTLTMLGTSFASAAFAEETTTPAAEEAATEGEGETYDFGGVEVRVFGNQWGQLNPDSTSDDRDIYLDAAAQVEEMYNVKLVYSEPDGYDGTNLSELILSGISNGDAGVDILDTEPDALLSFIAAGALTDLTDDIAQIEVGSLYKNAATWMGRNYGMTFDNVGDAYAMVYSRDYLEEIGMDETPTEKFMKGEWSYDDCKEYLTEMKAKLPEGVYPMGFHYYHWPVMACAANGVVQIDSDGNFGFTDERWAEAATFYRELIDEGLAYPITCEWDADGNQTSEDTAYQVQDQAPNGAKFVIGRYESWQFGGLADSIGEWGICFWPWGDSITCDGDYTTLSEDYIIPQAYWGTCVIPITAESHTGISGIDLLKIANSYYDIISPTGAEGRHSAWEAEQAGETPQIGYEIGQERYFTTEEDVELYDWAHTRVQYDFTKTFDDAGISDVWELCAQVIGAGTDARSAADSIYQAAMAEATERGVIPAAE